MEASSNTASDDKWPASNLTTSLSRALKRSCRLGYSNDKSLYFKLWQEVKPLLLPNISHLIWERFTRSSKKVKTHDYKHPQAPAWDVLECQASSAIPKAIPKRHCSCQALKICPLCGAPDAGRHVLEACTHKHVKGLYIARHNEAVATSGKAIIEGARCGCLAV